MMKKENNLSSRSLGESEKETANRNVSISTYGPNVETHKSNPNAIRTTKYTWYSWLPKSLWEQFRRIANIYFLGISILMVRT